MSFPKQLAAQLSAYLLKNWALGRKRFPLVLMLEPTERCNLACSGCGRIREYRGCLDKTLSVAECLSAVDEVGAPTVTVTGGEPLLHPRIEEIVTGIIARRKHVHLCTNGLLLDRSLDKFKPGPYLNFVLHMDGLGPTHDQSAGQEGVFETAIAGIKAAKQAGFRIYTNTTVYKSTDFDEIDALLNILTDIGVDGFMISPAFDFDIPGSDMFLSREEITRTFQPLDKLRRQFHFYNTSAYIDFLLGNKNTDCMPWSTPTLTPMGWRRPCYLIADEHRPSYRELMEATDWDSYGVGNDPRCANCMVHCGFEASLIDQARRSLPELFQLVKS
jgi:hopanoid biosynthesis associated radical SAM protein HpnH